MIFWKIFNRNKSAWGYIEPFDYAQDRPFDYAQDRPFDYAQDRPFDYAQDRPVEAGFRGAYINLI